MTFPFTFYPKDEFSSMDLHIHTVILALILIGLNYIYIISVQRMDNTNKNETYTKESIDTIAQSIKEDTIALERSISTNAESFEQRYGKGIYCIIKSSLTIYI